MIRKEKAVKMMEKANKKNPKREIKRELKLISRIIKRDAKKGLDFTMDIWRLSKETKDELVKRGYTCRKTEHGYDVISWEE